MQAALLVSKCDIYQAWDLHFSMMLTNVKGAEHSPIAAVDTGTVDTYCVPDSVIVILVSANFTLFLRFVYFVYMSTRLLSSDTAEEGIGSRFRWL